MTQFGFADPALVVGAESGVINQQGRAFTHGFEIHLERATLQYEFAVVGGQPKLMVPLTIYDDKGGVVQPQLGDGDPCNAFDGEIAEVVRSLETGKPSAILSGDLARDAVTLCRLQSEAVLG
jgi:hypothetical protein